jgi:GNAT superfamily N-acetyltransferase
MPDQAQESAITIREAAPEDCAAVAALAGQLGYKSSPEQVAQRLRYFGASTEHNIFVAQIPGGEIVGWIGMYIVRTISSDARLEISGLVVDEKHRSRNVGARLLKSAEEWGAARGFTQVTVHTNVLRQRAHLFYEHHGYHLEKTQKLFRKTLESVRPKC